MAEAARDRGYRYLGVSDHSQSAHYAGGLSVDEILRQHELIAALNEEFGPSLRILKGIESDIRADGSLDYPDDILASFDFVIASVHSGFRRDKAEQTARIVKAVSHPYTTILGHPTGRLLLRRPGYEVEMEAILAACAEYGVAIEINCNPHRLDLDWRWHRRGAELGCLFSINPDAHSIRELDLVRWGVAIARKGGLSGKHILNTRSLPDLLRHLEGKRGARAVHRTSRNTGAAPAVSSRSRKRSDTNEKNAKSPFSKAAPADARPHSQDAADPGSRRKVLQRIGAPRRKEGRHHRSR
jgi:DNA polymerase (family 10)